MPQALLPLIPDGATQVNGSVSVVRRDRQWTYLAGIVPIFSHPEGNRRLPVRTRRSTLLQTRHRLGRQPVEGASLSECPVTSHQYHENPPMHQLHHPTQEQL